MIPTPKNALSDDPKLFVGSQQQRIFRGHQRRANRRIGADRTELLEFVARSKDRHGAGVRDVHKTISEEDWRGEEVPADSLAPEDLAILKLDARDDPSIGPEE